VTLFDKTGTFKLGASQMGGGDFKPMPDWQMIAAIVEIDGGPIFVKVTGPKASVSAQKDALVAALKTLRLAETRKK
jgi:hypothetical protein